MEKRKENVLFLTVFQNAERSEWVHVSPKTEGSGEAASCAWPDKKKQTVLHKRGNWEKTFGKEKTCEIFLKRMYKSNF